MPQPRTLVVLLVLGGYLALARAFGNLYPISRFDMYAGPRADSASRVIARASDGAHEIDAFVGWQCEAPPALEPGACAAAWPYSYSVYLDRAAADFIAHHAGAGGEPVEVVRRIWRLSGTGAPPSEDCLLARCRAVRR